MSEISKDAIEAAREGVAVALHGDTYEGVDPAARQEIDTAVGAALTAAEPIMRAVIVEEVAVAIEAETKVRNWHETFLNGMNHAASIARSLATGSES